MTETSSQGHSWQFWCLFGALCLTSFIGSIDATIVTTALPTITREIGGGKEQYVWIANSFVLASTAPQPLFGQISNIIGRRQPMLLAISLFALGSGIAAGAKNPAMLISGRAIQGLGIGGTFVLLDVICCDMVPLRERGKYLGFMLSTAAIGTTVGPLIGGALAQVQWRWIFYMNLPVSSLALLATFFFLNVKYTRNPTWKHALARVDFLGNAIFMPSIIAILLGLVLGGVQFAWSSYHIIVPLVLGFLGWVVFHIHQASPLCKEPSMPPRLFQNRTSAAGFLLTFLFSMLITTVSYFMPVYFQAVKGSSPFGAGVRLLPYTAIIVTVGVLAGLIMSKTGLYRPLHFTAFALIAIGYGLLSLLDAKSNKAAWASFQVIVACGTGITVSTILPAILAALPESDVATATGTFSFIRSFGFLWGVTLPSIVFNGQIDRYIDRISDVHVRAQMVNGAAYSFASGTELNKLPSYVKAEVIGVYVDALKAIWQAAVAFACLGFLTVFVEKHIDLRTELSTEFGFEERMKHELPDEAGIAHNEEMATFSATAESERGLRSQSSADATKDPITISRRVS